jgi:proteasome accessory factor A
VLAGDSNLCEPSAWLKVGTTVAVLDAFAVGSGVDRLGRLRLAEPSAALRQVARNPSALLELADGRRRSALDVQREFLEVAGEWAEPQLAELWGSVLDALAVGEPERVADVVEWVAKRRLLQEFQDRHRLATDDPKLAQLDLAFHELGGIFGALEAEGLVRRLTTSAEVRLAMTQPPADTRAAARGAFVADARRGGHPYSVDWQTCTIHDPDGAATRTVALPDPLVARVPELDELLEALAARTG